MDKTIRVIFVMMTIIIFYILSWLYLRVYFENLYLFVISPLFWIILAIFSHYFIFDNKKTKFEYKKLLTTLLLTSSLLYVVLYFGLGVFVSGFAHNVYNTSLEGMIYNFWSLGLIMIMIEIVRSSLINANTRFNESVIKIIIILLFTGTTLNYFSIQSEFSDIYGIFRFIGLTLIPTLVLNSLLTESSKNGGPIPGIIYMMIVNGALWVAPILPDHKWVVMALLSSLIPFLTLVTFDNRVKIKQFHFSRIMKDNPDPKAWSIRFAVISVVLLFFLGITPFYPINILTNSMYPQIHVGDVVIVQKCKINDIEMGDIIQYQKPGYTVIHRVIEIKEKNGIIYLYTKGDNNKDRDSFITTDKSLLGKVRFTIPKAGLPNVWLKNTLDQINQSKADGN